MQAAAKRIQTRDLQELLKQQSGVAAATNPLVAISPAEVPADKDGTSIIRLDVFQVSPFKGNPRTETNEKRAEIRESIRAAGLQQKIHVCKHPTDGYITARGGCTRLGELHTLASEKDGQGRPTDDAKRFQQVDFILVPYTTDSDLLVCHLSENLQRSDMSFWDTAAGVFNTCAQLERELEQTIGVKELEDLLQARGLSVNYTALIDYVFALENLSLLPVNLRHSLTRNDIRLLLRPGQRLMLEFWQQHGGRNPAEFIEGYRSSVALIQDSTDFSVERLHGVIRDYIGMQLGYEADNFQGLLEAYKLDKKAPLADLLDPPAQQALVDVGTVGASTDYTEGDGGPNEGDGDFAGAAGGVPTDKHDDPSQDGIAFLGSASVGATGQPGLQVASGLTSKKGAVLQNLLAEQGDQSPQSEFDGMQPLEVAQAHLQAQLQELSVLVGVQDYLVSSAQMPAGFYMELPEPGHLGGTEDLAVQGWWLLACLSGQLSHAMAALPEESVMRAAMADDSTWSAAIEGQLGGAALDGADFIAGLLTSSVHVLAQPALELVQAIRALYMAQDVDPSQESAS